MSVKIERFWPYAERFDPKQDTLDVYVTIEGMRYVGTFISLDAMKNKLGEKNYFIPEEVTIIRDYDILEKTIQTIIQNREEFDVIFTSCK